jgi:hypothetical protein
MRQAKNATLVLCLFVFYCVLLSQGLKASAASAFFGALAAVPLTIHLYHLVWPPAPRSYWRAAPLDPGQMTKDHESNRIPIRGNGGE